MERQYKGLITTRKGDGNHFNQNHAIERFWAYSETKMTSVFTLMGFTKNGFLHETTAASIS